MPLSTWSTCWRFNHPHLRDAYLHAATNIRAVIADEVLCATVRVTAALRPARPTGKEDG